MDHDIMSPKMKKYLHYIGSLLAICGVVFVTLRLHQFWQSVSFDKLNTLSWGIIFFFSVMYGITNFLLAQSWRFILQYFSINTSPKWAIYAYGISQLAKYVPGNVFHIAGRQAIAMSDGFPGNSIFKSNIIELIMISCLGGLAGWIVLGLIFPIISLKMGCLFLLISLVVIIALSQRYLHHCISKAIICHVFFLLLSATIFTGILNLLDHHNIIDFSMGLSIGGVYTIAWLAGLIMPGAPAGIGIRELVVLFFLGHFIPEAELLLAVLLGRIVTVVGDVIFFVFAYSMRKNKNINGRFINYEKK